MRQFSISDIKPGNIVDRFGTDFHYLVRVRRVTVNSILPIVDDKGMRYLGTVIEVGDHHIRIKIGSPQGDTKEEADITLVQGLSRSTVMDRIVRQVTELGITAIVPVISSRTQGRMDGIAFTPRIARWERITLQATQQSGTKAPLIANPVPLQQYLEKKNHTTIKLLFSPKARPLVQVLKAFSPNQLSMPFSVQCAIGPEGGFTTPEEELFKSCGFHSVGLGAAILRTDTAAIASIAAVKQILFSEE